MIKLIYCVAVCITTICYSFFASKQGICGGLDIPNPYFDPSSPNIMSLLAPSDQIDVACVNGNNYSLSVAWKEMAIPLDILLETRLSDGNVMSQKSIYCAPESMAVKDVLGVWQAEEVIFKAKSYSFMDTLIMAPSVEIMPSGQPAFSWKKLVLTKRPESPAIFISGELYFYEGQFLPKKPYSAFLIKGADLHFFNN